MAIAQEEGPGKIKRFKDYENGMQAAENEGKPILLYFCFDA